MANRTDEAQTEQPTDYCPAFQHAVELIGRRWTGSILKVLGGRALRFSQIRTEIPGLSDRLLDARLTELESEGIVSRTESHGTVVYSATLKGIGLGPALESIALWAEENNCGAQGDALPGRRRC